MESHEQHMPLRSKVPDVSDANANVQAAMDLDHRANAGGEGAPDYGSLVRSRQYLVGLLENDALKGVPLSDTREDIAKVTGQIRTAREEFTHRQHSQPDK